MAQNDVQISQHLFTQTHYNPALTGNSIYANITMLARHQFDDAARKLLEGLGYSEKDIASGKTREIRTRLKTIDEKSLAGILGIGEYTLHDIIGELEKPGRDPREKLDGPILRSDVMDIADLKPGMILTGTVRNVIDFGAFVDIGVHQDGLVHISQLSDSFVKHPLDVVSVGDVVQVKVLSADADKKRISLTMKGLKKKH